MHFEDRTICECPRKSVVQIPDICGLFIVDEFQDDRAVLRPLRGWFKGFLFRTANPGILRLSLSLETAVRCVWFDDSIEIDDMNLFGELELSDLYR